MSVVKLEPNEAEYIEKVKQKKCQLDSFLRNCSYDPNSPWGEQFAYWAKFKEIVGNFNNDLSFLASMRAKEFLVERFKGIELDMGSKPQGAKGLDIDVLTNENERIIAEIKTTVPYQLNFGANQKVSIKIDLEKLRTAEADYKFMMVTNQEAYDILCGEAYRLLTEEIEIICLF